MTTLTWKLDVSSLNWHIFSILSKIYFFALLETATQFCWVSDCSTFCSAKQFNTFCNFILCSYEKLSRCYCWNLMLGSLLWHIVSNRFDFSSFFWKNLTLLLRVFHASTFFQHPFQIHFVFSVLALAENNLVCILTLDNRTSCSAWDFISFWKSFCSLLKI